MAEERRIARIVEKSLGKNRSIKSVASVEQFVRTGQRQQRSEGFVESVCSNSKREAALSQKSDNDTMKGEGLRSWEGKEEDLDALRQEVMDKCGAKGGLAKRLNLRTGGMLRETRCKLAPLKRNVLTVSRKP